MSRIFSPSTGREKGKVNPNVRLEKHDQKNFLFHFGPNGLVSPSLIFYRFETGKSRPETKKMFWYFFGRQSKEFSFPPEEMKTSELFFVALPTFCALPKLGHTLVGRPSLRHPNVKKCAAALYSSLDHKTLVHSIDGFWFLH